MAIKDIRAEYAGAQLQAAGILAFCYNTKKMLLVYRSAQVADGETWCGVGGKIEPGETPEEAARREFQEEAGLEAPASLTQAFVYEDEKLKFTNYIGIYGEQQFPKLNWESDGYAWVNLDVIPEPIHYGLKAMLEDPETQKIIDYLLT